MEVLDKIGFVTLIDHMGNDERIANAARQSTGKTSTNDEANKRLVRRLIRDRHTSPIEHVIFTFHVKAPMHVVNQWVRHRTGSFSIFSKRYSEAVGEFYVPSEFHAQHTLNKQMSSHVLIAEAQEQARDSMNRTFNRLYETYQDLLKLGVSRETARLVLPEAIYSEFHWTVNLHNLFHFLSLRLAEDAQWEIRQYAETILAIIKPIVPNAVEAWEEFVLRKS